MKKITFTILLLNLGLIVFGQISGNHVFSEYNNNNYNSRELNYQNKFNKLYLNDSSFLVEAKVVKNVKADAYVAVFGLSQEATTVTGANTSINERIKNFINNLKKLGIKNEDIYTDLLTQYKVYDFKKLGNSYEEYMKGFELSKNVLIKYSKPEQIEQMLTVASQDSIFDLVKVDYIINDISKVYDELFLSATEVIKKKKQMYVNLTDMKLKPAAQIYGENFASYYPSDLYKSYKAFTQNYYENYYWLRDNETKRLHKFQTYYYDEINYSGFDKVINPVILEPTIQVALTIQLKYDIQK
ncbi:SIMPL domain-containing protein [Ferruginibacter sp. SUN002]|uniref:SIMPL domain-containing protein n=1 Tax=Ferruginibacter sp. SUN002 TaxID=2937789 RepID=UPI003D361030